MTCESQAFCQGAGPHPQARVASRRTPPFPPAARWRNRKISPVILANCKKEVRNEITKLGDDGNDFKFWIGECWGHPSRGRNRSGRRVQQGPEGNYVCTGQGDTPGPALQSSLCCHNTRVEESWLRRGCPIWQRGDHVPDHRGS